MSFAPSSKPGRCAPDTVGQDWENSASPCTIHGLIPLVVDLDGTLLRTDSFLEGLAAAIAASPVNIFKFFSFKNRLDFKEWAARFGNPDNFPLNTDVLKVLKEAKGCGRPIWLATASPFLVADALAVKLKIFDGVLASGNGINLKGQAKAAALVEKFGNKGFDYIGDARADVPVWQASRTAFVVSDSPYVCEAAEQANPDVRIIRGSSNLLSPILKLLRVRQWVKNLLVFLPMFLAHTISVSHVILCLFAFFSLCFCASAIYVINDFCDLEHDRAHPFKKERPLASGAVP